MRPYRVICLTRIRGRAAVASDGAAFLQPAAKIVHAIRVVLDGLIGPACCLCARPRPSGERAVCPPCEERLPWWRSTDGCPRCGMPTDPGIANGDVAWGPAGSAGVACPRCLAAGSPLHRSLAATRHAGPIQRLIPVFKNPRGPFGPPPAAWRLVDFLADELVLRIRTEQMPLPDFVVAVPLHPRRLQRRGFNHAALIAARIATTLAVPFDPALLVRIRDTRSQAGRNESDRRTALRGAFRARIRRGPAFVSTEGPRVFLVDDVLTTGSTLEAAADALLADGAREVWALTLSATVPGRRRPTGGSIG